MNVITLDPSGGGTRLSHEQIELLVNGYAMLTMPRVVGFDTPQSMKLSPEERRALEDAKRCGYYYSKPEKVRTLAFYWLETAGLPQIEITEGTKVASITMDVVSLARAAQPRWEGHPQLYGRISTIAKLYGGRIKSTTSFTSIDRLPRTRVSECASALRALWDELTGASS